MFNRKEKERELFAYHLDRFNKLKIIDPFFVVKTAFFQKGKYGKQIQLFESELRRGEDIFIEFIEVVRDNQGKDVDLTPANSNRDLFKFKYNPYFSEEYEIKEGSNSKGEPYHAFIIPLSELNVVLADGSEITYGLFEKRKEQESQKEESVPKLQTTLSIFPDFEENFSKKEVTLDDVLITEDALLSEMSITDFAAIMWKKPVSNKLWLNTLIEKQ
jgi:hypothetical protein